jgi:hypothetical protein
MGWSVERETTGEVLVCADYEILSDNGAVALAEAIWAVAHHRLHYADEGGSTRAGPAPDDE